MTAERLLATLHGLDIRLWLDGDRLRFDAPRGAMTPEVRSAIVARRAELTLLLRTHPLSVQQRAVWAALQAGAGNKPLVARLEGPVDPGLLEQGLHDLVARHALLRTCFPGTGDSRVQVVTDGMAPGFTVTDAGDDPAAVDDAVAAAVFRRFDVGTGPLVHVHLMRERRDASVLVITLHPLLWDGQSRAIFVRDLAALVLGRAAGPGGPPLEPLAVDYPGYASWQQEWLTTAEAHEQLAYWRAQLAGATPLPRLPGAGDGARTALCARRPFGVDDALDRGVAAVAERSGVTPHTVHLAAFQILLRARTGVDDMVIGVPFANRVRPGTGPLIGQFVNTLPLRVDVGRAATIPDLLRHGRDAAVAAQARQEVPASGAGPAVEVTFDYYTAAARLPEVPGLRLVPRPVATGPADAELTLSIDRRPDGLHGTLVYATDVYDAGTMGQLADGYLAVLRVVVAAPAGDVRDVAAMAGLSARH